MNITDPEPDDEIEVDTASFDSTTFRVSDIDKESIGLTEIVAITLIGEDDRYVVKGATHSDSAVITNLETNEEWHIDLADLNHKP